MLSVFHVSQTDFGESCTMALLHTQPILKSTLDILHGAGWILGGYFPPPCKSVLREVSRQIMQSVTKMILTAIAVSSENHTHHFVKKIIFFLLAAHNSSLESLRPPKSVQGLGREGVEEMRKGGGGSALHKTLQDENWQAASWNSSP